MTDIPEHFYETARSIRNGVIWESNGATRIIAEALYEAWKEGPTMPNETRIAALSAENERLRKALERLFKPFEGSECRKDHHGYCQAHFLEADCCVAAARRALEGGE